MLLTSLSEGRIASHACFACLVVLALMVRSSAGASMSLFVGSAEAKCGGTVEIPVMVSGASNVDAFGMTLEYDATGLSYVSTAPGTATSDWAAVSGNETTPGQITIGGFKGAGAPVNGMGQLFVVTLACEDHLSTSDLTLSDLVDDVRTAATALGKVTVMDTGDDPEIIARGSSARGERAAATALLEVILDHDPAKITSISTSTSATTRDWPAVNGNETAPSEVMLGGFKDGRTTASSGDNLGAETSQRGHAHSTSTSTVSDLASDNEKAATASGKETVSPARAEFPRDGYAPSTVGGEGEATSSRRSIEEGVSNPGYFENMSILAIIAIGAVAAGGLLVWRASV
jgi:cohesin domain-containing protein